MRTLAVMLMLGGAGASFVAQAPVPATAARRIQAPAAEEVPLLAWSDLADRPCRWLGRNVSLRIQVESHPSDWNPYLTRFGTGQFDALQGWADEQFPWIHDDYDAPAVRVFVRKGSPAANVIAGAKPYARFELTGVVREVFLDLPWIEITGAVPMSDAITEASVIHAARAIELLGENSWDLAQLELDQALEAPLPDAALIELVRLREECIDAQAANDARHGKSHGQSPPH
jgi:hypothetical protein